MHDAQSCARQHRYDRLGPPRHVDGHSVAGDQAEICEGVSGLAYVIFELRVGDRTRVADGLALPVDGDAVTVARLNMPVDAVVGDIECAADEPLRHRGAGPVEDVGERRSPGQSVRLLSPERQPVGLGLPVQVCCRIGVGHEFRRRRVRRRSVRVRLGHGVSVVTHGVHCGPASDQTVGRRSDRDERRLDVRPTVNRTRRVCRRGCNRLA